MEYGEEQGITISASTFEQDEFYFLLKTNPKFIKFAYSRKEKDLQIFETLGSGIEAIVSCDVMTDHLVHPEATKLFCLPLYPVYFNVCFDTLFPRFNGFSDHTLGIDQTLRAVESGATVIEKHITLNHSDINCPDSYFALRPGELSALIANIRQMERGGLA